MTDKFLKKENESASDRVVRLYSGGDIGPNTAARLLAVKFAREHFNHEMTEEELEQFERELEREQGK